jgi:hypothetical protein
VRDGFLQVVLFCDQPVRSVSCLLLNHFKKMGVTLILIFYT